MKRIEMAKYGFVRWPEKDFSDDSSRFICYRVGTRVRVSKCTYKGEAYIDGSIEGTKLPYEVYSKLPHYSTIGRLNGVSISSLTDKDLIDLYEACLAYEQEYIEAENTIQMPTLEEIQEQCQAIKEKRKAELFVIYSCFNVRKAIHFDKYQWSQLREYLLTLEASINTYDPATYPQTILNTANSIVFCKSNYWALQDSAYYKWIMERISK